MKCETSNGPGPRATVQERCGVFAPLLIALALLGGCSQKGPELVKPISEIKGKPIASAPIASTNPTPATQTVAAAAAPVPAPVTNAVPARADGFLQVGFERLASFHYMMPDEISETDQPPADQFPKTIRELDQKPIALRGFMLPLKVEQGLVTEMLLMKDQSMCCYGTSPKINEWVSVKMKEQGVKPIMDQPVTLLGKLQVGEMRENGYLVGVYQMDGEKMEAE